MEISEEINELKTENETLRELLNRTGMKETFKKNKEIRELKKELRGWYEFFYDACITESQKALKADTEKRLQITGKKLFFDFERFYLNFAAALPWEIQTTLRAIRDDGITSRLVSKEIYEMMIRLNLIDPYPYEEENTPLHFTNLGWLIADLCSC